MATEDLEKRVKALEEAYTNSLEELNELEDRIVWLEDALHALAKETGSTIEGGK